MSPLGFRIENDFELFDSIPPVHGETQIRTAGLRVSSYVNSDGIPIMTSDAREILLPALQAKNAFDLGLRSINDPQPQEPELPAVITRANDAVIARVKDAVITRAKEPAPGPICVQCGASFPAKRSDARFCSPACRQRAKRGLPASTTVRPDSLQNPCQAAISAG